MPKQSPHGNLTAILVVVAFLDLVFERLLGRLFMSPACTAGIGCAWPRYAPFLLYLTGLLALIVGVGGVVGHLKRGELFPRGVRFTVAGLSLVFWLLVGLSLLFGRMPERYQFMLEASFAFVIALLVLSFAGTRETSLRMRLGFLLFALPTLLHIVAVLSARRQGPVNPDHLAAVGELTLLAAAAAAPLLLLPREVPRARFAAGLAMAAGLGAFFAVAYLARTDLMQTIVLYTVQLELPRAATVLGAGYVVALLGFVTAAGVLLLSPGPARLSGLGMCLVGSAGYQTSAPVALSLSMCGLVALSTGTLRTDGVAGPASSRGRAAAAPVWRSWLQAIADAFGASVPPATPAGAGGEAHAVEARPTVEVETVPAGEPASPGAAAADLAPVAEVGVVRARHRGRDVVVRLSRSNGVVRAFDAAVGTPLDSPADATIEAHETWMARAPEERAPHARVKAGDPAFDRVLGVYGAARLDDRTLRRRLLRLAAGTVSLWNTGGARFVSQDPGEAPLSAFAHGPAPAARAVLEVVDVLCDLLDAGDVAPPPPAV